MELELFSKTILALTVGTALVLAVVGSLLGYSRECLTLASGSIYPSAVVANQLRKEWGSR
jgi:hypothetical protein